MTDNGRIHGSRDGGDTQTRPDLAAVGILPYARAAMTTVAAAAVNNFWAERGRWPNWLPVLLGLGIASYFMLASEPPAFFKYAWAAFAFIAFSLRRHYGWPFVAATSVAIVLLGFGAAQWRTQTVAAPALAKRIGPVPITGVVQDVLRNDTGAARLVLDRPGIPRLAADKTPRRIRVTVKTGADKVHPGDRVRVMAVVMPPSPPVAPGTFDFARQAWFQQLGGLGYALGSPTILDQKASGSSLWGREDLAWFRERLATRIRGHDPGPAGAVAAALMTGHRNAIPDNVVTDLRDSGLAHLLAISGLHIGLVAGFVFFLVRAGLALWEKAALNYPIKKWSACAAFAAAVLYLAISGATVPTQRALVMTGIVLLAVITDRTAIAMRPVALAAVVILLFRPESLLSVGFQLSFAAVIGLVAAYEFLREQPLGRWLRSRSGIGYVGSYFAFAALTTVIAELAIAPFTVFHFGRVVTFGLAANLVAVPIMAMWVMPWAVVSYLLMPLGLEEWSLTPMLWGIKVVISVADTVSAWPGAVQLAPGLPIQSLGLITLGGLWLCLWGRPWRLAGIAVIGLGLLVATGTRSPDIIVDGSARLFAVRNPSGQLVLSSARKPRRVGKAWLRQAGQAHAAAWPDDNRFARDAMDKDPWLACDNLGCLYRPVSRPRSDGGAQAVEQSAVIAIVKDPRAFEEDCRTARLIISLVPLRGECPSAGLIIDRFDLWREGAHAIWFEEKSWFKSKGVRVRTVGDVTGARPWSAYPPNKGR